MTDEPKTNKLEEADDDDDYMSDAFLAQCLPKDVKPGLKRTHQTQREHELGKKKMALKENSRLEKVAKKSAQILEHEKREEGLQKSLDQTNKGFAMLQKMGYKAGDSLGKSNAGIVTPIPLQIKSNRGGLGRDAILKEIEEEKKSLRAKKMAQRASSTSQISPEEFRAQLSLQRRKGLIESDLFKSQKVCEQLDLSKDIAKAAEIWFWPKKMEPEQDEEEAQDIEEEEEFDSFEPHEMLLMLTTYLRKEHLYCLWCGHSFSDHQDLEQNCPGRNREDHDE